MTNAMAAFGIAAGGASLICYVLTRLQNRRATVRGRMAGTPAVATAISAAYSANEQQFDPSQ